MRLCIDEDIWLANDLSEEDSLTLRSLGVFTKGLSIIPAQKIDLEHRSMESLLDIIEEHTDAYISLHRYDLARYSLTLEGRFL